MLEQHLAPGLDIKLSPLGLGTVKLGRDQGVKYPNAFKIPNDQQASRLLSLSRELGINVIDTAPAYGNSEQRLGKLLNGQRHDWVIVSKVGEEFENGESSFDFSPEHIRFSIERSLKRLNTDYIDFVLLHSDGNDLDIINSGALDYLHSLKKEGLIRACGMSTKTVAGGLAAAAQSDCVMVTYNLNETNEGEVLQYCADNNKTAFIKKALASGHISNNDPKLGVQKSMEFVFSNPGANCAIVGTINPEHLKSNVGSYLKHSYLN